MVVYATCDRSMAQAAESALLNDGFLVRCQEMKQSSTDSSLYTLNVLVSEAQDAQKVLMEKGL